MEFVVVLQIALIVGYFLLFLRKHYWYHIAKASEATRGQALDHQNHDTYIKYQSVIKSVDIQASFFDLVPDYECRDMEQSMAHHRDPNAP